MPALWRWECRRRTDFQEGFLLPCQNQEISEQLLYMLSRSVTLEELVLENSGLKA